MDGVEWVIPLRLLRLLEHLAVLKTAILAWDGFPDINGLKYSWKNTRVKKERGVLLMLPLAHHQFDQEKIICQTE